MNKDNQWLTRYEAAERAGRSVQTIDIWRRNNGLAYKKDRWGHVVVSAEDLERIINPKEGK